MQLKTLLALLPALAAVPTNAYFILSHSVLETTRMDPIISPGGVSQHVHSIVGGSNFDDTMTYQSALASGCTTAPVSVDKSNYWTPQLYYYGPDDQSFQMIPVNYVNTYYLPRGPNNSYNVSAFPDGLRMIAGNPYRRTYDASSFADQAISFVCLDYNNDHSGDPDWAQRNNFFDHNCPSGMRMQVNFPSCWDGVNLDSADHTSHMAYASGGPNGGGNCPSTHPVHLVTLFYEFIYNVQNFPFNNASYPTWVLANGDTTGYGFHGDFVNGWAAHVNGTNVLQQALDQCNDNNGVGGELNNCPPFVPYLNSAAASACKPQNDQIDEDIGLGHKISKLPGDNPLWIGNSTTKPAFTNYTEPNTTYTNFQSVIPTGYNYVGCIAEGSSGRALTGKSISNANMTRGACVSFCQSFGFPLAGVEYGQVSAHPVPASPPSHTLLTVDLGVLLRHADGERCLQHDVCRRYKVQHGLRQQHQRELRRLVGPQPVEQPFALPLHLVPYRLVLVWVHDRGHERTGAQPVQLHLELHDASAVHDHLSVQGLQSRRYRVQPGEQLSTSRTGRRISYADQRLRNATAQTASAPVVSPPRTAAAPWPARATRLSCAAGQADSACTLTQTSRLQLRRRRRPP
jgi:hypothetical protein